jgi:dolichol-phosphate mannosyltransferase
VNLLIVIPTYNEKDNVGPLIEEIGKHIQTDILVIDDSSPDGTADIVRQAQKTKPFIHLIQRSGKMGLASAYLQGFRYAIDNHYDLVFEMDADFSHNPKYLPHFIGRLKDADLVIGSRYIPGGGVRNWSRLREMISRGGNLYARLILEIPIKDITGGFKGFRVQALKQFDLDKITSEGYSFQIEMNYLFYKNGFQVEEIPIVFEERREGQSKMSKKIFLEALKQVWKFRLSNPKNALRQTKNLKGIIRNAFSRFPTD